MGSDISLPYTSTSINWNLLPYLGSLSLIIMVPSHCLLRNLQGLNFVNYVYFLNLIQYVIFESFSFLEGINLYKAE